jgi:hypothetical protein
VPSGTFLLKEMSQLMKSLTHIIGCAPSEVSTEELLQRVVTERDRVRRSIFHFREHGALRKPVHRKPGAAPAKPKKKKATKTGKGVRPEKPSTNTLLKKLSAAGLSIEDLQKVVAAQSKRGAQNGEQSGE